MSILQRKAIITTEGPEQSHWTIETLREYLLTIIAENEARYTEKFDSLRDALKTAITSQKLAVDIALEAADRAVTKSEIAAEKRFESVNEFRSTLSDQQSTFMPRGEATALFKSNDEKLSTTQRNYDNRFEALRVSFEKSNEALAKEIASLRETRSETSGKAAGTNALWGYLVAIAGIALALILHFVK